MKAKIGDYPIMITDVSCIGLNYDGDARKYSEYYYRNDSQLVVNPKMVDLFKKIINLLQDIIMLFY